MPITPTNITKHIISPYNKVKGFASQAIYGVGVYGRAIYGQGTSGVASMTNAVKHSPATGTTIGSPMGLLLTITYATSTSTGSGWYNVNKN